MAQSYYLKKGSAFSQLPCTTPSLVYCCVGCVSVRDKLHSWDSGEGKELGEKVSFLHWIVHWDGSWWQLAYISFLVSHKLQTMIILLFHCLPSVLQATAYQCNCFKWSTAYLIILSSTSFKMLLLFSVRNAVMGWILIHHLQRFWVTFHSSTNYLKIFLWVCISGSFPNSSHDGS